MATDAGEYTPHGLTVDQVLRQAGFDWVEPGYWSVRAAGVELGLLPQVMNAGAYQLSLYVRDVDQLRCEVLVDVKPRPGQAR